MAGLLSWTAVKHKLERIVACMLQVSAYGSEEQSDTGEFEAHVHHQNLAWGMHSALVAPQVMFGRLSCPRATLCGWWTHASSSSIWTPRAGCPPAGASLGGPLMARRRSVGRIRGLPATGWQLKGFTSRRGPQVECLGSLVAGAFMKFDVNRLGFTFNFKSLLFKLPYAVH